MLSMHGDFEREGEREKRKRGDKDLARTQVKMKSRNEPHNDYWI